MTAPAPSSAAVTLRGGAGSVTVDPGHLELLANRLVALADRVEQAIVSPLLRANRPSPAALLDPIGGAEVLARATATLTIAALVMTSCLSLAGSLRAAASAYREVDGLDNRIRPLLRAVRELPPVGVDLAHGRPQAGLVDDPELADAGVQLVTGLVGFGPAGPIGVLRPDAPARLAAGFGRLYPDSTSTLTERPDGLSLDGRGAPRSVADLFREVAVREDDDAGGGAIDVRVLQGPSGRRVIVDISGTTSWDANPLNRSADATDFGTNLRALGNQRTVMGDGIRLALQRSGVGRDEPIMLVGHSQGGMVAAELAGELDRDHEFTVTHVVTAGSPIGLSRLSSSISVLSLENRGDAVPELDGSDNPARDHWLTATVTHGPDTVLGRHSVDSYVAGAADFDADTDCAVKDWQSSAAGYLDASTVRTTVFRIGRN